MTTSHWTSALADFLGIVLADLAALVRECPDNVWEMSMWDVTRDRGWGRPQPPVLADGNPDPRGVNAHSAVWYATLHLVYTLDWNFSARVSSWEPPAPFRKDDLDATGSRTGRIPAMSCWPTSGTCTRRHARRSRRWQQTKLHSTATVGQLPTGSSQASAMR